MDTLLSLVDVDKSFGDVEVVRSVSLDIHAGELVAVVGPSGSGKSTMLHLLAGFERPTRGQVLYRGRDLATWSDYALSRWRRRRAAVVFQAFNLLGALDAVQNVALPLLLDGVPRRDALRAAHEALEAVGLEHRAHARPGTMSGGEMQRVAVARALAVDPAIIFADEPTGSLDSKNGERVMALLAGARTASRTVVVVTHDPRVAAVADRVVRVADGQVVSDSADLEVSGERSTRRLVGAA